jgi:hypothetical protein
VGGAALEREPAAKQPGPRPVAAVAQSAVLVGWRASEELLELGRAGSWVVAQPMPPPGRQHDEVSGGEWDLVGLAIDLEPTGARGDHVEGGVPVARDAKTPRRPQHRAAIDGAADPYGPQHLTDGIGGIEVAKQVHGRHSASQDRPEHVR